ncbi:hypothetical protein NPIL_148801 [Nephila pilipes]|uniref:Uncharacterized protein n=1 Tax=Nephila pilipes TaxID=299642 RepID=A0A8X6PZD0_NEPPI|nr:hypothetical protein NPIL_148801 [Nephila pilipes]
MPGVVCSRHFPRARAQRRLVSYYNHYSIDREVDEPHRRKLLCLPVRSNSHFVQLSVACTGLYLASVTSLGSVAVYGRLLGPSWVFGSPQKAWIVTEQPHHCVISCTLLSRFARKRKCAFDISRHHHYLELLMRCCASAHPLLFSMALSKQKPSCEAWLMPSTHLSLFAYLRVTPSQFSSPSVKSLSIKESSAFCKGRRGQAHHAFFLSSLRFFSPSESFLLLQMKLHFPSSKLKA